MSVSEQENPAKLKGDVTEEKVGTLVYRRIIDRIV